MVVVKSNDDSNGNETMTTNFSDLNHTFTLSAKVVLATLQTLSVSILETL